MAYSEVVVQEELDRGAFGAVCRGNWRGNNVAVKVHNIADHCLYIHHLSVAAVQHWQTNTRDHGGLSERGLCHELSPPPQRGPVARSLPDSAQTGHHHGVCSRRLSAPGAAFSFLLLLQYLGFFNHSFTSLLFSFPP